MPKTNPIISVMKTTPKTVIKDYEQAASLAGMTKSMPKKYPAIVKINLSWSLYYPACSTPPWQLDAALKILKDNDYDEIIPVENQTVVTHPWKGAYLNKWLPVMKKYDVKFRPLTNVRWVKYKPKTEMLAMDDLFGEILVPKIFKGTTVLHLPTVKTHGHTTTTGSMKNAFGGLIPKYRHHAHKKIHEVLVDLLAIQKDLHKGIFALMDGTVAGNGAGPRTMIPVPANMILAGADQVAIDAIAAKMMGFDPMKIKYIKLAHDRGLGIGDPDQIEIAGMERSEFNRINLKFHTTRSPIVKWDQRIRKGTQDIKVLHDILFHSPAFKTFILASEIYHDKIWYNTTGKKHIEEYRKTPWNSLFESYEYGEYPKYEKVKNWNPY